MRICLVSLGCPKNQVDGEVMLAELAGAGHKIAATPDLAEVVIVNTCGFIRDAQRESIDAILTATDRKSAGKLQYVVATGCLTQRFAADLLADIPELDAAVGTGGTGDIAAVLDSVARGQRVSLVGPAGYLPDGVAPRLLSTPPWTAYLKVSEGCDNRCAYCAIPDLRGPHRSRPLADLAAETAQLVGAGVREVTLVGQDLTRWGDDLPGRPQLADLLTTLSADGGPHWLRLHYLHPARVTGHLLETIAGLKNCCRYLDLPMQHGSDRVLVAMRRGTTRAGLIDLVGLARSIMPDVAIRSSFIVGFPGETEADFGLLRSLMREVAVDWAGVFAYSREDGTPAGSMPDQVPARLKVRRRALAMTMQRAISRSHSGEQVGRRLEFLIEGDRRPTQMPDGTVAECLVARSYREAPSVDGSAFLVLAQGQPAPTPGSIAFGRVFAAGEYDVYASLESESPQ